MNIHEAANIASNVLAQYIALLEKVEPQGGERYTNTIRQMSEAKAVLDSQYPQPIGINVSEFIRLVDKVG